MKKKAFLVIGVTLISLLACASEMSYNFEQFFVNGIWDDANNQYETPLDTVVYVNTYSKKGNEIAKKKFGNEVWNIHHLMDRYHDYDQLNNLKTINDSYGKEIPIAIHEDLFDILSLAKDLTTLTNGKFQLGLGTLIDAWNPYLSGEFGKQDIDKEVLEASLSSVPTSEELNQILELNEKDYTVIFHALERASNPVILSLGGIGKGFAMDKCASIFEKEQEAAYLYAGGSSIRTVGVYPGLSGDKWALSWLSPTLKEQTDILFKIQFVGDYSFSTSGDYQKYYLAEVDDQEVHRHHILDPMSGYPNGFHHSITVMSKEANGAILDALSTAMFNIESSEEITQLVAKIEEKYQANIDYFIVDGNAKDYEVTITKNMYEKIVKSTISSYISSWNVIE